MADAPRKVPLVFYRTAAGEDVVRNWLRQLEDADRNAIGQDLMRVQFRWPIGMPLCRSLGDRLWEVRSRLRRGRTARVIFCFADGHLIALHGFVKTTRTTPTSELALARKRQHEFILE